MTGLSRVSTAKAPKLTLQILERMPCSRADELQGLHQELQKACRVLQSIADRQWSRLLAPRASAPLNNTLNVLRQALPALSQAIVLRQKQEEMRHHQQKNRRPALYQHFPALSAVTRHPLREAQTDNLLEVAA